MLNCDQLDHRKIKDLAGLGADHGRVNQVRAAPAAAHRDMVADLIRHRPRLQPEALTALLLTGLAP
jgi:hypothetical protein